MRHRNKGNHLGRTKEHRDALLKNMSNSLIAHKRITTTLAKAKALRVHLEPLITKAKNNTTHSRRVVFSYLQSKDAVKELFGTIAERVGDRPGGYLRIIKTGFRKGDGADMAMIEFVDFNEVYSASKTAETTETKTAGGRKRTRRGGSKVKSADTETAAAATATTAAATTALATTEEPAKNEEE